jgi:hypothetical protein
MISNGRMFRILILISLLIPATAVVAHDRRHPELDHWYDNLRRPSMTRPSLTSFTSCCSRTDCHTTDAELRSGEWWAKVGIRDSSGDWGLTDWVKVPPEAALLNHDNPTGEGVICHSMVWPTDALGRRLDPESVQIWRFVPPSQS